MSSEDDRQRGVTIPIISFQSVLIYLTLAYLIGAVPTGVIAARLLGRGSLFHPGRRKAPRIGDVFKVLGMKVGLIVTLLDVLKGMFAVWPLITMVLGPEGHRVWWIVSLGALCAVIGHCNSAFLGFRGGRGLATSFGALLPLLPVPTLGSALVYAVVAFWMLSTRPGALSGAGILPLFSILWVTLVQPERQFYLSVVAFLSLWTLWEQRESLKDHLGFHGYPPDLADLPPGTEKTIPVAEQPASIQKAPVTDLSGRNADTTRASNEKPPTPS